MKTEDKERLLKLLGMLGSEHDGERAAAALKASQFLKKRNLSWSDVLGGGGGSYNAGFEAGFSQAKGQFSNGQGGEKSNTSGDNAMGGYFEKLKWIKDTEGLHEYLSDWEKTFVMDVFMRNRPLSNKQRSIVDGILEKGAIFGMKFTS